MIYSGICCPRRLLLAVCGLGLWSIATQAVGQYGASPVQTGLFFDDLRARQKAEKSASEEEVRDGEVTYDYESGVYRDTEDTPMGQRPVDYEEAREISRPSVRSGSAAYSARGAGDYTNYAGQYTAPTSFFAPTYVSDPFLAGRRNLKLGPVNVGFGFYQALEYNDNVNRSTDIAATPQVETGAVSDVISSSILSIDANYAITKNNRLSITTAMGFDYYFEHPELAPYGRDGVVLNVLPGSTIAFDIKAGPVYITVYDRFSMRPASRNDFALSSNQVFGVFQNDVGVAANWRINSKWTLAVNLMHSDSNSVQASAEAFSRTTDSLHTSLTFSPNGTWSLGFQGGITALDYDQLFNNDGFLVNVGLFLVVPVSTHTYVRLAAGYQSFTFDDSPLIVRNFPLPTPPQYITSGDGGDLRDFYYSLTFNNRLNSRVSHSLSIGHESALNVTSNYVTANFVNYGVTAIAWRGSRFTLSAYMEDASASGGVFAQDTFQYGFDAYFSHRLTSKLNLGVGYHYGFTDVNAIGPGALAAGSDSDFEQQAFNFDLSYLLSRKASLFFSYRFYLTNVLDANSTIPDFEQNRLIFGVNYNF